MFRVRMSLIFEGTDRLLSRHVVFGFVSAADVQNLLSLQKSECNFQPVDQFLELSIGAGYKVYIIRKTELNTFRLQLI